MNRRLWKGYQARQGAERREKGEHTLPLELSRRFSNTGHEIAYLWAINQKNHTYGPKVCIFSLWGFIE